MSISNQKKQFWNSLSKKDQSRIVQMAWEDRTSFEAIEMQFNISANDIERFMRRQLNSKDYKRWRRRANSQGHLKHEQKRPFIGGRFKCTRQRMDGSTKGWK